MNLPFPRSYWVEPARFVAGYYPGHTDPREADRKLESLLDHGVSCIVNLMESEEVDHRGQRFIDYEHRFQELARLRDRTVRCLRFEIEDRSIPTVQYMNTILESVCIALEQQETIYLHCWGGRGRTGTVVGCYLRRTRALGAAEALQTLGELTQHNPDAFWPAPQMPCQRAFIEVWKEEPKAP